MPRPPLPVGTSGRITVYELGERRYRARTRYRDYDGVTRPVERVGASRTAAENNLRAALRDRGHSNLDGEITADTKMTTVAELWFRDIEESDRAIRTKITYRESWDRHLVRAVGQLRLRDMRVSRVDRIVVSCGSVRATARPNTPRSSCPASSVWPSVMTPSKRTRYAS